MSYFDIYKGYIYCHISPSGKKYIGKTERSLNSRWANGKGYSSCTVFKKAIDKYGWENFEHMILEEIRAETKEELQEILSKKERDYILKYNTLAPNGYNLTTGGEGVTKVYIDLDYSPEKISYEKLYQWYIEQQLSIPEIASLAKCSKSTVYNTIDRYCLNRREYGK